MSLIGHFRNRISLGSPKSQTFTRRSRHFSLSQGVVCATLFQHIENTLYTIYIIQGLISTFCPSLLFPSAILSPSISSLSRNQLAGGVKAPWRARRSIASCLRRLPLSLAAESLCYLFLNGEEEESRPAFFFYEGAAILICGFIFIRETIATRESSSIIYLIRVQSSAELF